MTRGPLGGPRPFAGDEPDIVMQVSISIGALDKIEEGKRDVTDKEAAEIEAELRDRVLKSHASGPAQTKIDVKNIMAQGNIKIFLGHSVGKQQIEDIEYVMKEMGYKIADYTISGE